MSVFGSVDFMLPSLNYATQLVNTDTFHAQYRVIEAFSMFNAILSK